MTMINLGLEIDHNAKLPKIEYQLIAPSGRIVEAFAKEESAITRREKMRANGATIRLIEVTTITITREID